MEKNIEIRERQKKNAEKASNNIFFTFIFLYRKNYILPENIFGKT